MSNAIDYLKARGCMLTGEVVGKGIHVFGLPGEQFPGGRLYVDRSGSAQVWHVRSPRGLTLGEPWKRIGEKVMPKSGLAVPAYMAHVRDLAITPDMPKLAFAPASSPSLDVSSDSAVRDAAGSLLAGIGWKRIKSGAVEIWQDGAGETPACRLSVKNGMASVWSHRGDVDLSEPWRKGRVAESGVQTYFATGKDLGLAADRAIAPVPVPAPARQPVSAEVAAFVRDSWNDGVPAPADHPQLNKGGAALDGSPLRAFPDTKQARAQHCAGDLIVPLFRPAAPDAKYALELVGGQRLMKERWEGTDKMLLPGTTTAGAFMPLPPDPLMRLPSPGGNVLDWMGALGRHRVENEPLVICEGVSTGLAIHQAGAGNVLCAISSGNLASVAKWVRESGLDNFFPAGVVIAADYDVARHPDGKLKSNAIAKAIEAAEIAGGRVALAPAGSPHGADARDLLCSGGVEAVTDYIEGSVLPGEIRKRSDVFQRAPVHRQPEPELER